ncbi:MAG TPA: 2-isopropylmalate synthase [Candidatus Solibacter sp.]|jgi:2-isopropylmalate synthase|nr:2-isopropylmalate synthase [Candidatus Solibacter sp.]
MSGVSNGADPAVGPESLGDALHDGRTAEGAPEDQLIIFDTTLRDGEQSPGASMSIDQKLQVAQQLERLGVDVIEAGFPNSSPGDFAAVSAIAETIESVTVAGLARIWPEEDILKAADALSGAKKPRIHTFVGTSPLHRDMVSWAKTPQEILERAVDAVKLAKSFVEDVEFSPMDASRTEKEYLVDIIGATIEAGATTINVPDTVGYATPAEWQALMQYLYERVPTLSNVVLSVHCHDDLGMSVANSLSAVLAGARQIEGCINGIGERAGNASVEEIATAVRLRPDIYGVWTKVDHSQIYRTSRMVSQLTGMLVQPNKAVVGANAFAHASGIHQDGVLKNTQTFEIINAADVGTENKLVLGKLSGRHAFRVRLEEMGYQLGDEEFKSAFKRFKSLADKKKEVTDRDLESIVADEARMASETFKLEHLQVSSGTSLKPTATVRIAFEDGTTKEAASVGDGPVDAAYRAINEIVQLPNELKEFRVQEVTAGIDAVGEVNVRVRRGAHVASGHGADTDILVASARAYLNALNKLVSMDAEPRIKPEDSSAAQPAVAASTP